MTALVTALVTALRVLRDRKKLRIFASSKGNNKAPDET